MKWRTDLLTFQNSAWVVHRFSQGSIYGSLDESTQTHNSIFKNIQSRDKMEFRVQWICAKCSTTNLYGLLFNDFWLVIIQVYPVQYIPWFFVLNDIYIFSKEIIMLLVNNFPFFFLCQNIQLSLTASAQVKRLYLKVLYSNVKHNICMKNNRKSRKLGIRRPNSSPTLFWHINWYQYTLVFQLVQLKSDH